MKFVIFIVMFLLIVAFFIISNGNFHLTNSEQRAQFFLEYYDWFVKIFGNTKTITGYVVDLDWLP